MPLDRISHYRMPLLACTRLNLHFNRQEAAGALGDLGTFIPLVLGMVLCCGLQIGPALFFAGVMNVIAGLAFGIPVCTQPMKAIAAVAIAEHLHEPEIIAAGVMTGIAMLLLVFLGLSDWLQAAVPKSVVRGVQLALGLKLLVSGLKMIVGTGRLLGPDSLAMALLCVVVAAMLWKSTRLPAALVICAIGLAVIAWSGFGNTPFDAAAAWHLPDLCAPATWWVAFWYGTLPQIPLTILNSGVAVCALSVDLFPRRPLSLRKIAVSIGLMDVLLCPLGAMPMCYGAGGLAAQYRFGARTGGSLVMLGASCILLVLLLGNSLLPLLQACPHSILGVLLGLGALELVWVCRDQTGWRNWAILLVTASLCYGWDTAGGVLIGCFASWLFAGGLRKRPA